MNLFQKKGTFDDPIEDALRETCDNIIDGINKHGRFSNAHHLFIKTYFEYSLGRKECDIKRLSLLVKKLEELGNISPVTRDSYRLDMIKKTLEYMEEDYIGAKKTADGLLEVLENAMNSKERGI